MHANNVSHFAIHASDVGRAKTFYENVFGWRFEEWGPQDFYLIQTGNEQSPGILGALPKRTEPLGAGCNGYECSISVVDIKETEASIIKNGGTIIEIPNVGLFVKFSDTEGNVACAIQYFARG